MDALPSITITVAPQHPQLDSTKKELSDEDILEVTDYKYRMTYSSDEYGSVSDHDHPSEDLSDLALAIRDETFVTAPGIIMRTYSSSDESITARDDSDDSEMLEASPYHGTTSYTSDEYGCDSDHPSEDLSDLALAIREDSFIRAPRAISRTYSSSDESVGMGEADQLDGLITSSLMSHEIGSYADDIQKPGRGTRKNHELDEEWKEGMEEDGYASTEDNADGCDEMGCERTFEAMDCVPTSKAQWLFVMAWNGDTSSCGEEEVGDIETIPSDGEISDVDGLESEGGCGSIHTMESSGDSVCNEETGNEERRSGIFIQDSDEIVTPKATETDLELAIPHIGKSVGAATAADQSHPDVSDIITPTNVHEVEPNPKSTLSATVQSGMVGKTDTLGSDGEEVSDETNDEDVNHSERISDVKPYICKRHNAFQRFMKKFFCCFGGS